MISFLCPDVRLDSNILKLPIFCLLWMVDRLHLHNCNYENSNDTQVISSHHYVLSSWFKPVQSLTQSLTLLAGWEGSLGTCSRWAIHWRNNLYTIWTSLIAMTACSLQAKNHMAFEFCMCFYILFIASISLYTHLQS